MQWAVPEASANSGSGNIYFQIDAPTSHTWAAVGIGSGMAGAQIFLVYTDGEGNVTLSTRPGRGHIMPQYQQMDGVQLIAGSGVHRDRMVANVRCSSCDSLDLDGRNSWIAAWKSGDPLDTTNPAASISMHDSTSVFNVDLSGASVASDSNPFLGGPPPGGTGGDGSPNDGDSSSGDGDGDGDDGVVTVTDSDDSDDFGMSHGIIMTIVFTILYPVGSMVMPLIGKWLIHSVVQLVAYLLMWAGLALGVITARHFDLVRDILRTGVRRRLTVANSSSTMATPSSASSSSPSWVSSPSWAGCTTGTSSSTDVEASSATSTSGTAGCSWSSA